MATRKGTPEQRFWARVEKTDSCWVWTGARNSGSGYGVFRPDPRGSTIVASRYSWSLRNGPIPIGMIVCHHCDNPPCVNPDHLFIGTYQDNMDDRGRKGRTYNGRADLTHCKHGHEFTPENTIRRKTGRTCRACFRVYQRELKKRQRAILAAGGTVSARYTAPHRRKERI